MVPLRSPPPSKHLTSILLMCTIRGSGDKWRKTMEVHKIRGRYMYKYVYKQDGQWVVGWREA